jgi:hypothetical protein
MNRVESLRAARSSPQVVFSEYLKLRARFSGIVLVFEGRECPSVYVGWVFKHYHFGQQQLEQIIARGKKNVLELRNIITNNRTTTRDLNIYFVDKDFDENPKQGTYLDVYVTRGYSIENEVITREVVERYIHSHFDIADADDAAAKTEALLLFDKLLAEYFTASRLFHHLVYACRRCKVQFTPNNDISQYIEIMCAQAIAKPLCGDIDALLEHCAILPQDSNDIKAYIHSDNSFATLDPTRDWRGKFHLSFLRCYFIFLRDSRLKGHSPFSRIAKMSADPAHPAFLSQLAQLMNPPNCLLVFLDKFVKCVVIPRSILPSELPRSG